MPFSHLPFVYKTYNTFTHEYKVTFIEMTYTYDFVSKHYKVITWQLLSEIVYQDSWMKTWEGNITYDEGCLKQRPTIRNCYQWCVDSGLITLKEIWFFGEKNCIF